MGRGMIKGVSAQLFKQFSANAKAQLVAETSGGQGTGSIAGPGTAPSTAPDTDEALAVGALLGRTLWQMVVDFFRRLFGKTDR